jgi:NAD(P)-dependent dehydrogenase (short-subunit alcohol dehydrogenase family)
MKRVDESWDPDHIASLAVFLASEASDYVSGTAIIVDGRWLTT